MRPEARLLSILMRGIAAKVIEAGFTDGHDSRIIRKPDETSDIRFFAVLLRWMNTDRYGYFSMGIDQRAHTRVFLKGNRNTQEVTYAALDRLSNQSGEIILIGCKIQSVQMAVGVDQHGWDSFVGLQF
jgi:hypothetical protein